jgi:amino acid transporter
MLGRIWRLLIGPVLSTRRVRHERLPVLLALPVFASDALSSSAYATEEMMLVLWSAGEEALRLAFPISLAVVALLFIVVFSYRQTVYAYPQGGGAFIVSRENLGEFWGVLAASALLVGYVLTVAVSIAAGVNAIISAFPALLPYRVSLCILFIALMTLINLRGARESGLVFAPPTYGFVLTFAILILVGLARGFAGDIDPAPYPPYGEGAVALSWLVVLTAFARGCSALTGVEAISDGVPAFRSPESRNAALTLLLMALILAGLVLGITYTASHFHVLPVKNEQGEIVETLTSRLARTVLEGTPFEWFYYVVQVATTLILILAANTAYVDFPRLSSVLANARFAPRQLANLGDRLVFNNGIILLGLLSALLIIYFRGDTHSLIPLYAVGVFIGFTLSQAGMARRFARLKPPRWRIGMMISGFGAFTTGLVLMTQLIANFRYGAWITLVSIGVLMFLLFKVHEHYITIKASVEAQADAAARQCATRWSCWCPACIRACCRRWITRALLSHPDEIVALHVNLDPRPPAVYRRVLKRAKDEETELRLVTPAAEKMQQEWRAIRARHPAGDPRFGTPLAHRADRRLHRRSCWRASRLTK